MSGKSIVIAVVLAGWFVGALIAFVTVALFGFLGVGLVGVLIAFVATQFELDAYAAGMIHHQLEADRQMSQEQRAAKRNEQSFFVQSTRFFRHLGIALALIGFGGFASTQYLLSG